MFPLGIFPYIVGGILIGIGVSFIYIITGLHATQSSFFSTTLSYFSKIPYFQQKQYLNSRGWRITFAVGVIFGALVYTLTLSPEGFFTTSVQWWRLVLGGLLVGFGTRLSKRMYLGTRHKWVGISVDYLFVCGRNLSCCRNTNGHDCSSSGGGSMRMRHLIVFIGGLLFGFGLAFGGMSKQEIVLSFLQLKDLGLLLLLGGSAFVTALTINLVPKVLKRPFLGGEFKKRKRMLSKRTIIGAIIFG